MKQLTAIALALVLLIMSSPAAYPQAEWTTENPPPVAPTLVREGDLAISLVSALDMGTTENETEAETLLASAGIAPKNGWISDYPVTPDILGELRDAVADAADSYRLPMDKTEALEVLDSVSADLGLYALSHEDGEAPPLASSQYTEPTVINNYYYREGPPVITYYPPPANYLYLYAWVPYPFWCNSFYFSGFFILHDFHKVVGIGNRVVVVSNHFFHRHHRRFYKIDPAKRKGRGSLRAKARRTQGKPRFGAEAHRGARSILQRSRERLASQRGLVSRKGRISKSSRGFSGWTGTEITRQKRPFSGRTGTRVRTFHRQHFQKGLKNSDRSFTALGRNREKTSRHRAAPGRDSFKKARQTRAFGDRTRMRTKTSRSGEVKTAHRDAARFSRNPSMSPGRSSSLPSVRGRGFSGTLGRNAKGFSERFSRKFSGGNSDRKGSGRAPF
jgi:hypothetical protein